MAKKSLAEIQIEEDLAWKRWRETTEFFPFEQMSDVIIRPDCHLPSDMGWEVTAVLNNAAELKAFVLKFVDISAFIEDEIVKVTTPYESEDDDDLFDCDDGWYPEPELKEVLKVLYTNEFFEEDKNVQLQEREVKRYDPSEIELGDKVKDKGYPLFARVCLLETFDRMGKVTIKQIGFFELSSYVKHPVQVS